MVWAAPSVSLQVIQRWEKRWIHLEGCATIHRDQERLKKWANSNFMGFSKEKCEHTGAS